MKLESALTAVLVTCALLTTGLVVYREVLSPSPGPYTSLPQRPLFIEDWTAHLGAGVRLGPPNAAVQLIEFADFECPYCATFHRSLKALRSRYPNEVALWYVHYPLPMHRFAEPAARAAECAHEQDRFEVMHDLLFEQQNQIGSKSWDEFAAQASVPDLKAFSSCIKSNDVVHRIAEGHSLGEKWNIPGTPTLVINGWKLTHPVTDSDLDRMVKAVLAGKRPVLDDG